MIIYRITNKINNKIYIGQTIKNIGYRWSRHCNDKRGTAISNAIQKYGKDSFIIEEIDGANDISELNYLEEHYIHVYNSLAPNGYNLTRGGRNRTVTEATKEKLRNNKFNIGRKATEESRKKMSVAKLGNQNGVKNKAIGPIYSKKFRTPRIKKPEKIEGPDKRCQPFSEDRKLKMSEACKGRKFTEAHRKKLSEARKGRSFKN